MSTRLTRQSFLSGMVCPRLGWYSRRETPPLQLTPEAGTLADRFRSDEQRHVHERASAFFPNATTVSRQAYEAACWQTQDLLDRASTTAIREAAFGTATCRARADSLVRTADAWHLYEVRADTALTPRLLDETAYIWMVLDAAGVALSAASILLVSPDYRAGLPDSAMFVPVDVTSEVSSRAATFAGSVAAVDAGTRGQEPPAASLIPHCRTCPMFPVCFGNDIEHPLFELPHLSPTQLSSMLAQGYRSVDDVPEAMLSQGRQTLVWRATVAGDVLVVGELPTALESVIWPACYLNFETVGTTIPRFDNLAPHERVPFLYSARFCSRSGALLSHRSFLSPHERDGSRELAERLLQDVGSEGSVIVYSQYQARVIRWLAQRYPDMSEPLERVRKRIVDLESIIRHHVYHPDFRGRTSLGTVIRALLPQFTYTDLEVEDSATASASYAYLARGDYYSSTRAPLVRRDLYAYGARTTLALVRLHEAVERISRRGQAR